MGTIIQPIITDDMNWVFFEKEACVSLHILLHLGPQEFKILQYLYKHRGRVVRKRELWEHVWGFRLDCDKPNEKIMCIRVCQTRVKMLPFGITIETITSIGWKLNF